MSTLGVLTVVIMATGQIGGIPRGGIAPGMIGNGTMRQMVGNTLPSMSPLLSLLILLRTMADRELPRRRTLRGLLLLLLLFLPIKGEMMLPVDQVGRH